MSEEKKKKILIASVLKPVNDTRMVEKIAQSLADTKRFDIHVIGFPADHLELNDLILHPLPYFSRLDLRRFVIPWKILKQHNTLSPDLFIITTHELLWIAVIAKLFTKCKLIYDVQENYYRNISYTSSFPFFIRNLIAVYVRLKEIVTSPFVDHFFLAENSYQYELNFIDKKFTILENKVRRPEGVNIRKPSSKSLLFSGTLADSTGVFVAIEIAKKLHEEDPGVSLTLIGRCAQPSVLMRIQKLIGGHPFIKLVGGNELVPHQLIIEYIRTSTAGIIAYPPNPSTAGSTPTKLYEYLGYQLPILLIRHPQWQSICAQYGAAYVFDPDNLNPAEMLNALQNQRFYIKEPVSVYWESEQPKLIRQVYQLFF